MNARSPPAATIDPSAPLPEGQDYSALVEEGLSLLEQLAGGEWTDFNEHDPGVTLLEALAYCVTDLAYRADLPVADLLARPDGTLDLAAACLYPAEQILPTAPVTALDLQKLLLSEVPGLRAAWPWPVEGFAGLFRVFLALQPGTPPGDRSAPVAAAVSCLSARRALGELAVSVQLAQVTAITLSASVTTVPRTRPEVLMQAARSAALEALLPAPAFLPRTGPLAPLLPTDLRFEGPLLSRGLLADDAVPAPIQRSDVGARVREALLRLDGVESVGEVTVAFGAAAPVDGAPEVFQWDPSASGNRIAISPAGLMWPGEARGAARTLAPSPAPLQSAALASPVDAPPLLPLFADAGQHHPVQELLPPLYRVGREQVGAGSPEQRAQADQLRGYLLLFDQVLATCSAQLGHLRERLALGGAPAYVTRWLGDVPGAGPLLGSEAALRQIVAGWNRSSGAPDGTLDFLLARFAERFDGASPHNFETAAQKQAFLADYPAQSCARHLGIDRERAAREGTPSLENLSGLERRVNALLAAGPRQPLRSYPELPWPGDSGDAGYQKYLGRAYYLFEPQLLVGDPALRLAPAPGQPAAVAVAKELFAQRLVHLLTNWTYYPDQPGFCDYVEGVIAEGSPAHLGSDFLWLWPAQMDRFAERLAAWYAAGLPPLDLAGTRDADLLVVPAGPAWELWRWLQETLAEIGTEAR